MSFDDVAKRMQERHQPPGPYGIEPPPVAPPPDADAIVMDMHRQELARRKQHDIMWGAILLVGGIILTAVTYDNASTQGGTYVIAYGPMIVGAIRLFRGLVT